MKIVGAVSIVAAAVLALTVVPSASAASQDPWISPAANLSASGQDADSPQIATAPDGTVTAVWHRSSGPNEIIQAATRPPGGSFGSPVNLSANGQDASDPQIAIGADGTATAVWYRNAGGYQVIQATTRPSGGSFGSAINVSTGGEDAYGPQVAVAPDGTSTVVWWRSNGSDDIVQAATRPPSGSFSAPVNLSQAGGDAVFSRVAVAPDGTTTVIWRRYSGSDDIIQAATRPPAGSFGAPVSLSAAGADATTSGIAIAPDGTATVVWNRYDGTSQVVQAATRPSAGSFSAPENLSVTGGSAYNPQVATAADGTATVVWNRFDGSDEMIQAVTRPPAGAFGAPVAVSAAGQDSYGPQIGVAPDGTARVVWNTPVGDDSIIRAATRPPSGSFAAPVDLSGAGRDAYNPQIVVAPDGAATATWQRSDNANNSIIQAISTVASGSNPPVGRARLRVARVAPKRPQVRRGRVLRVSVTVRNVGNAIAGNTRLCVRPTRAVTRALRPLGRKCLSLGALVAGKSKAGSFRFKAASRARKGRYRLNFTVTANGARAVKAAVVVRVR